jgi:hypothetical protein
VVVSHETPPSETANDPCDVTGAADTVSRPLRPQLVIVVETAPGAVAWHSNSYSSQSMNGIVSGERPAGDDRSVQRSGRRGHDREQAKRQHGRECDLTSAHCYLRLFCGKARDIARRKARSGHGGTAGSGTGEKRRERDQPPRERG